ncbi:hypothetical protein O5190_27110, partial [Escherichia coli]|nr:hypothetical protein [Escherichia coli]
RQQIPQAVIHQPAQQGQKVFQIVIRGHSSAPGPKKMLYSQSNANRALTRQIRAKGRRYSGLNPGARQITSAVWYGPCGHRTAGHHPD